MTLIFFTLSSYSRININEKTESIESTQNGVLQNTSGGTLSGDFPPKTKMFSAENTLKIHRKRYFATPRPHRICNVFFTVLFFLYFTFFSLLFSFFSYFLFLLILFSFASAHTTRFPSG